MMIKRAIFLAMLTLLLIAAIGCEARLSTPTESGAEDKGDAYFYDEKSGKVLTDLSESFDFKIEQWALKPDHDTGEERLLFSVGIKNKTKSSLRNFKCDILFDEDMLYLFTTGLTNYDQHQPVDFIPYVTGNGASYSVDLSVNTDEQVAEFGADKSDLLDKVKNVSLKLSWDGGEETVTIDCGELNQ